MRSILLAFTAVVFTACGTWQAEPVSPGRTTRWDEPVRVTLSTSEVVMLSSARVVHDTLFGVPQHAPADSMIAVPLSRVWRVQSRAPDEDAAEKVMLASALIGPILLFGVYFAKFPKRW